MITSADAVSTLEFKICLVSQKTPSELGNLMLKTFQLTLTWQDLAHTHMHFWYVILKGGIFYPWGREKISPPFKNTLTPPSPFPTLPRRWGINTAMISRFGSERSWLESFSSFHWANSSGLGSKLLSQPIGSKHIIMLWKTDDLAQKCTILKLLLYHQYT